MRLEIADRGGRPRLRIATGPDRRIADLLTRYPGISVAETQELRRFIDSACPLEVQRLRANRALARRYDRAVRDLRGPLHKRTELLAAIFLAMLFLASCWLLWSSARF